MKISLDTKIAVLITIPLLAFITVSGFFLYNNWQNYRNAKQTLIVTNLFGTTAKLIKGLQTERSSVGKLLIEALTPEQIKIQRSEIDKIVSSFNSLISSSNIPESLKKEQNSFESNLFNLRKSVDSEISGEVFDSYNQLIDKLIKYEINVARQITFTDIQMNLINISILEQSRESGAQLQSMLLPILLSNAPLSISNVGRMEKLYNGIVGNMENPLLNVSSKIKKNITDFQQNEEWQMITLIYSSILAKSSEGQYGLDLTGFNESMANAIMQLDSPIEKILEEVTSEVNEATQKSSNTIFILSAIILFSLITIFITVKRFTNKLSKTLVEISDKLSISADDVFNSSHIVATSSEELAKASSNQTVALDNTASSIGKLNSMVEMNSENAKNTATTSQESKNKADMGQKVVEQMLVSMQEINESNMQIMNQINHSNEQMSEIVKVIQEIGLKTKVINDIVFQTKLISFNASVEAARAGEHGKGFSVVAEEVGNLATISGNAAKEISILLEESIKKVGSIAEETKTKVQYLIDQGKNRVDSGFSVARQCAVVLNEIVLNVTSVAHMADEISLASNEQSQGVQEITQFMDQLNNATQQNAKTSENAVSASENLANQSEALKNIVSQLVEMIEGKKKTGYNNNTKVNWISKTKNLKEAA